VYASLTVRDGDRTLKPTQVAFDGVYFAEPPHLTSEQIEIVLVNGDEEQRHLARVLPHDPTATRIPIRLLPRA
jgi:hypothetical protein